MVRWRWIVAGGGVTTCMWRMWRQWSSSYLGSAVVVHRCILCTVRCHLSVSNAVADLSDVLNYLTEHIP